MRILRLQLENYRVYQKPLELDLPSGLVGVYGPNGAGKSYLIESIPWTLFGRSRTLMAEIRTSGVTAPCVTEVTFEHEGHLYVVKRILSGSSSGHSLTVRAQVFADDKQVCEGARDTATYLQSILGMDDVSFRASVFAEQKQLDAFSSSPPAVRRQLILGLLGITPLNTARDTARRDARELMATLSHQKELLQMLEDGLAERDLETLQAELHSANLRLKSFEQAELAKQQLFQQSEERLNAYQELRVRYERLVSEGKAKVAQLEKLRGEHRKALAELDELNKLESSLTPELEEIEGSKMVGPQMALRGVMQPNEESYNHLQAMVVDAQKQLSVVEGQLTWQKAHAAELDKMVDKSLYATSKETLEPSTMPSSEPIANRRCPLCGQELGQSYLKVQRHHAEELALARQKISELEEDYSKAAKILSELSSQRDIEKRSLDKQKDAFLKFQKRISELEGMRNRLEKVIKEYESLTLEMEKEVASLRQQTRDLQFSNSQLDLLKEEVDNMAGELKRRRFETAEAAKLVAGLAATLSEKERQKAQADAITQKVALLEEKARCVAKTSELLSDFRDMVVASVGPRLDAMSSELFLELTDQEYDALHIDPETYEIQISDHGSTYGLDRFSGSEVDLANLALRVAVSEQIRMFSGGYVGLLVLDEVFGSLDHDRKERMLLALERLKARFAQVLVVTHDMEIKEQLSHAIEVVKLRGRRATAVCS
ncbi:MAG: SMC family ATPase [Actinobacteria bacterium]|nr:SMC family ATPase [Actinomycetota bacterium]MCL6105507.1 SMC family ATPase [Actinomycetota bacterium]